MTFILRWPSILVLLALVLLCLLGALAGAAALTGVQIDVAQVQQVQAQAAEAGAGQITWLDVGLWGGAALFFLISAIRLIRRTQGFWTWLLGFACYGGRWAYSQGADVVAQVRAVDINVYRNPQALLADPGSTEAQAAILAIVLLVGLFIFIVDAADRSYWDKQGA